MPDMTKVSEVLVSKTDDESLFFKLQPEDPALDGRVDRAGESFDVPFWSYVSRMEVEPIMSTMFHKNLWRGNAEDPEWLARFHTRKTPFTNEELLSIGIDVPEGEDDEKEASKPPVKTAAKSLPSTYANYRILHYKSEAVRRDIGQDDGLHLKVGIIESNNPVVRAGQAAASVAIPGDLSDVRRPVRSTLYEALTPGGVGGPRNMVRRALGRSRRNQLRCPPGFENGGQFTDKQLSTCGLRLFDLPGFGLVRLGPNGERRGGGGSSEGSSKPLEAEALEGIESGDETTIRRAAEVQSVSGGDGEKPEVSAQTSTEGQQTGIDISRIALINPVGELDAKAREESIKKATEAAAGVNSPDFGRLVRRDGTMLDNVVPVVRLADVRNSEDMEEAFLVTAITDPMKLGEAEFQVMSAGLDGIVMATPDGKGFIRLEKSGAGRGSIRGMRRRWGTLLSEQDDSAPGAAFDQLVQEGGKKLKLSIQYPGIEDPLEMIEIKRGNMTRSVRRWVYALFLSEQAPMRPKATKPWAIAEGDDKK